MTKEEQLSSNRIKPKETSTFGKVSKGTFGKKPSNGTFGKRPSKGDFGKKPSGGSFGKQASVIKAKPKAKKSELPFLAWLHEPSQMSHYKCIVCNAPVQDWHHVKLYSSDKKDHKRLIPLCRLHHTGGSPSPHVTPVLWREAYSMEFQHKIADSVYKDFETQITESTF